MKALPHNRTYLVRGCELAIYCDDCAARRPSRELSAVGLTLRACEQCGRTPAQVEAAAAAYGDMVERDAGSGEA